MSTESYQIASRQWWVQRWLELLDSYRFKKRLERARIYAREGNVLNIEFISDRVIAKVQGSEIEPYQVSLSLDVFSQEDWQYILETMNQKAIFSARLLAGEMPDDIESVFIANGLNLFPFTLSDIHSHCTCPDKANPCKHIGAVYYQLAERFSEDPFVLFQLRGKTKTEIIAALRQLRLTKTEKKSDIPPTNLADFATVPLPAENISQLSSSENIKQFWHYHEPLESSLVAIAPSPESKTVLELLGMIPLGTNESEIVKQYLLQVYQTVSHQALVNALSQD